MKLEKSQILSFLPHRDPFLFIENIEIFLPEGRVKENKLLQGRDVEGIEVVGHYKVDKTHPIFEGHFPRNPILPGVIQIEMAAQTAGFALFYSFKDASNTNMKMALLGVKQAKFRKPIIPDRDVVIRTKVLKTRGTFSNCQGAIYNHCDELLSEMEVMISIQKVKES